VDAVSELQHNFAKQCFKQALRLLGRLSRDATRLLSQAAGNGWVQKGILCHRPQRGLSWHPEDIRHSAHWHFLLIGISRPTAAHNSQRGQVPAPVLSLRLSAVSMACLHSGQQLLFFSHWSAHAWWK